MKEKIVSWIRQELSLTKAKGIVMGLSGGIDSCVVACLAKEAVGKKRLLTLILPCHSLKSDLQDATLCARHLGIKARTIDLSAIYDKFIKVLPPAGRLARANLKPRLRMAVLYYFANKLNYLVCGTGNKSEIMAGYFTKHGDGATDILPIGDLLKTEVRALASALGIPRIIINKPPTAGLWPGQTDEGELGLSYAELDNILERIEDKKKQVLSKEKVSKVKRMIKNSQHKRQGPKICYL
jgi:NAD+ synthase